MGWWKSKHGTIGDIPADIMGDAVRKVIKEYKSSINRKPTENELLDVVKFVSTVALEKD